jgi:hypothetical protein
MAEKIGFERSGPDDWEGPVTLRLKYDRDHTRTTRYIGKLHRQDITIYVPDKLIPDGGPHDEIWATLGRVTKPLTEMKFESQVGAIADVISYDLSKAMSNSVRYDTRVGGDVYTLYLPYEVFGGRPWPNRVFLHISLPESI